MKAILSAKIKPGDIIVIRYEGPKGGPGMREMRHEKWRSRAPRYISGVLAKYAALVGSASSGAVTDIC